MPATRQAETAFWATLDTLIETSSIVIDRPKGSQHPRYRESLYPLDYGYLDQTTAADGGGIDIWRGSLPQGRATAMICCIDLAKRDSENKILIGCTEAEIDMILAYHSQGGMSALALRRHRESP